MKQFLSSAGTSNTAQKAELALREQRDRLLRIQRSSTELLPGDDRDLSPECADLEVEVCNAATHSLELISTAQERIRAGVYEICEDCGETIPKARLEALPFTTHCINCQREKESVQLLGETSKRAAHDTMFIEVE